MTSSLPYVAVDTCVIIDLLTDEDRQLQDRARWTLKQHGEQYHVLLPALVLAEVPGTGAFGRDDGGDAQRKERVTKALEWLENCEYPVAELTKRIALSAAQLASDHKLKGADATILATALAWHCTVLYTRDRSLLRLAREFPGLAICEPQGPPPPPPNLFDQGE